MSLYKTQVLRPSHALAIIVLSSLIAGCGGEKDPGFGAGKDVARGEGAWELLQVDNEFPNAPTIALLDDNALRGFDGCGPFRGGYHRRAQNLYVTRLVLENASCDGDRVRARVRNDFVQSLSHANSIEVGEEHIRINSEWQGQTLEFRAL